MQVVCVLKEIRGPAPKQVSDSPQQSRTGHSAWFLAHWKVVGQRKSTGRAASERFTPLAQCHCDANEKQCLYLPHVLYCLTRRNPALCWYVGREECTALKLLVSIMLQMKNDQTLAKNRAHGCCFLYF